MGINIQKLAFSALTVFISSTFFSCGENHIEQMYSSFKNPPESTKPGVYWYWMNEHVSKEGITKDLEAMKKVGIGEAFIGNIYEGGVPGDIKTLSDEWTDCMRHAIKEGSRLGVKISLFNGPGWSQSGGPWVESTEAMRFLDYTDTIINGSISRKMVLRKPDKNFQKVAVLAIPANDNVLKPISCNVKPLCHSADKLFDGDKKTKVSFGNANGNCIELELNTSDDFTCRSLSVYPTGMGFNTTCELLAFIDGKYEVVAKEYFDRSNTSLQLGPQPDGKMVMSFPKIKSSSFRIRMDNLPANFELSEIELSDCPQVHKITEKSLYKLPNTSNPSWSAYRWETQASDDETTHFDLKDIVNVTSLCNGDTLEWLSKPGKWRILNFGMRPTYTTNTPAAPVAKGLEIDKLSKKASYKHFESFVGHVISGLTAEEKKSLHRIIVDSYEVGPQNWSDDYQKRFIEKMGYDPLPYLPVLSGIIVGSVEKSDRFLWDMRRTIADLVAEEYVGGLRKIANDNGMKLWLENYGHWGFPSEFMYYGSKADEVGGEFWAGSGPSAECRLASSACHVYGKNDVYAESYTCGGNYFKWYPASLKQKGDWSYTEGVNNVIMHVYIHQPYEERVPGVNAWFGIEFNRHNTWFDLSKGWIDYQRRCSYMLQQGVPVRDLCVFIGEDAPQMNYWIDPKLSKGYSFDLINSDAIINRLTVSNGKLVLPSGIQYSALLLPPIKTMRPELMSAISSLVEQGAVVIATSYPEKSPSLKNYPKSDSLLLSTVNRIYPKGGETIRKTGNGAVYMNDNVNDVLKTIGCTEDVCVSGDASIGWIHRKTEYSDIYFLSNQGQDVFDGEISFRVSESIPELWNAVDGSVYRASDYIINENKTLLKVKLEPSESVFVVFSDNPVSDREYSYNKTVIKHLSDSWNINFTNNKLKQNFNITSSSLFDWKNSEDSRIKYFSGTAIYKTEFDFSKEIQSPVYLHVDSVQVMAKVRLNGSDLGYLWTNPYEIELTQALKTGKNILEIEVANLWVNRLLKEYALPVDKRSIWTLIDAANTNQPMESSGLIGNCYLFSK